MSYTPLKRVYSTAALEFWFEKLEADWEQHFSPGELSRGRKIYTSGEIREIELRAGDAIVYRRSGKDDGYALVEWSNGSPQVRMSMKDKVLGHSLAAAGLYEIEELVIDEVSPLPPDDPKKGERRAASGSTSSEANGYTAGQPSAANGGVHGRNGNGTGTADGAAAPAEMDRSPAPDGKPARKLVIRLGATESGLVMKLFWAKPKPAGEERDKGEGHGGEELTAVFQRGQSATDKLPDREREQLVSATIRARRHGFQFRPKLQAFVLDDILRISTFVSGEMTRWQRSGQLVLEDSVAPFARGVQVADVGVTAATDQERGGLAISWSMRLGQDLLDTREIRQLLRRPNGVAILPGRGLVRIRENQANDVAAVDAALSTVDGAIPHYMVFSLFGHQHLKIRLRGDAQAWQAAVRKAEADLGGLPEFLRPYQGQGVRWLASLAGMGCHALLADEMGLGKTLQVAALIARLRDPAKLSLIVCPASVVPVWRYELDRFFKDIPVTVLKSGETFADDPGGGKIWITSYTQLRRHRPLLADASFQFAVLDEAQHIKNPDAKVTQACMSIRAEHRITLTGTPIENTHLDLWTLFRFLMPGLLGPRQHFEAAMKADPAAAIARFREQVRPFILRRTKADVVSDLPPKVEMSLVCPMTDLQRNEYRRLVEQGLDDVGNSLSEAIRTRSLTFLTLLTRLRQVCCDPDLLPWQASGLEHSGKLKVLFDKIDEIVFSGQKVVIFSQFVSFLARVKRGLRERNPKLKIFELTGKTRDRETPVDKFQTVSGSAVFLVSLKAGGTGITLHAADYVFLLDPWWNPAVEAQAIDRVHRIGQDSTVFVYRMLTKGTIEDRVEALKNEKRELYTDILGERGLTDSIQQSFGNLADLIALDGAQETTTKSVDAENTEN